MANQLKNEQSKNNKILLLFLLFSFGELICRKKSR